MATFIKILFDCTTKRLTKDSKNNNLSTKNKKIALFLSRANSIFFTLVFQFSLSKSVSLTLALVFASTFLTITAQ